MKITYLQASEFAHTCDECRLEQEKLVHFGDAPDYEARWQQLCLNCLYHAVELLEAK